MGDNLQYESEAVRAAQGDVCARVLGNLAAGVVAVGLDGRVTYANDAARDHLNLSENELHAGVAFASLPGMHPFASIITDVSENRAEHSRLEITLGETAWSQKEIGVSISPIAGESGVEGAILLFSNMTERRRQERTNALNNQLVALGELAAGVVHQVRNPLTIITGRAELLLRQVEHENQRDDLESIIHEVNQIALSISTFLQCAKPFEFRPRECEASAIMERAVANCAHQAEAKSVAVVIHPTDRLEVMHVDGNRIVEALTNVVINGIEAAPEGGRVELFAHQVGRMTVFRVVDNGPGVHVEEGVDVFSPFYTGKRDGTGLGLSIAQRIFTLQGGTVRYHNLDGGGACFELEAPTVHGRTE